MPRNQPIFFKGVNPKYTNTEFAITTLNNPKDMGKPCITKGLATCRSFGLIFPCNKVLMVDPAISSKVVLDPPTPILLLFNLYISKNNCKTDEGSVSTKSLLPTQNARPATATKACPKAPATLLTLHASDVTRERIHLAGPSCCSLILTKSFVHSTGNLKRLPQMSHGLSGSACRESGT